MRYAQIRKIDISNGTGIRTSLFVQGCRRMCKGCFNPETWDFEGGLEWNEHSEEEFLTLTGREHITGATILGGEPMEPENRAAVKELLKKLKQQYPQKNTWMYSSYLFEEILEFDPEVLKFLDVLVDGPFEEEKKDLNLRFRGSSNQRIIDVKRSLETGIICLREGRP
ncbi:anaerobic ribonucleoside-triphosphate reductase activating protein [Anaerostipes sp.]|uniref:anaerobic ribonucleoside-triphosphate reductase activating protein n=1 Tax=Anaerostipes sp. TaxID=1872530 RepID=UPI0025C556A0|nr:anaerobic ribonucleoside-triphosphate reductase activating protein [Anaerostipes sp.]MBS7008051.1 anaerobic ribonucleoside-triphosphate reductase activating protein [Anaerostipes sp.]